MWARDRQHIILDSSQQLDYLKCPFCLNHSVEAKSGKTSCIDVDQADAIRA